jgi:hypothetical protein
VVHVRGCAGAPSSARARPMSRCTAGARGVTERTADEGRARASKARRTPERTTARSLARQQRVPVHTGTGVSKATTEGVTAIVPTANTHARRTGGRGCGGLQGTARLGPSGNLAATLARHAVAQGAGTTEDLLEATAAPELQRRRSVTTRGPHLGPRNRTAFLHYFTRWDGTSRCPLATRPGR